MSLYPFIEGVIHDLHETESYVAGSTTYQHKNLVLMHEINPTRPQEMYLRLREDRFHYAKYLTPGKRVRVHFLPYSRPWAANGKSGVNNNSDVKLVEILNKDGQTWTNLDKFVASLAEKSVPKAGATAPMQTAPKPAQTTVQQASDAAYANPAKQPETVRVGGDDLPF